MIEYELAETMLTVVIVLNFVAAPIIFFLYWRQRRRTAARGPEVTITIEDAAGRSVRLRAESTRRAEDFADGVEELLRKAS